MTSNFPDEPLLGMYVGRTMRQLVLFCDYIWAPPLEDAQEFEENEPRGFVSAFRWLQENYPDHPASALADAGIADGEFMSAAVFRRGQLKVFDAIADHLIWRFVRAELKGRPDAQILTEPVRAQLSASLAYCFNAFNVVVMGAACSADLTSYQLPDQFEASELICQLKQDFPLLSELLGYWFPFGNRQFYFFNSDFDYLSEYRAQPA